MQGRLRQSYLTVTIDTRCAYSGEPLQIELDSQLNYRVQPSAARQSVGRIASQMAGQIAPLFVFTPQVDWEAFHDLNIIDAY